jgi:aspartate kinase
MIGVWLREKAMESLRAIANREVTKITLAGVPDRPGIAAEVFGALGQQGINVELVVSTGGSHGTADISLAVARNQEQEVLGALESIRREIGGRRLDRNSKVALVSLVGHTLATEPGIAGRMFGALSRAGVNIEVISTSLSSVTCMIDEQSCETALAALRAEFHLE